MTVESIVDTNARRMAALDAEYNPIIGTGSPVDRMAVPVHEDRTLHVPETMRPTPVVQQILQAGSLYEHARQHGRDPEEHALEFQLYRVQYDFEYWAATATTIELDAETRAETGRDHAPLVLNRAQRLYWKTLYEQLVEQERPVRIILLKARQWGGSTLTQCLFAWMQRYYRRGWNAFVCNLSLDQARHVRRMYERIAEHYPEKRMGSITLGRYQGSSNIKQIKETDSIVGVTSIENPDSPRSYSIHLAHLSEVGLWPSTPTVNAADFAQAITGAVPKMPHTVIVEESTARGVGTYFHTHWQDAGAGRSIYEQVFIPWHDIPKYRTPIEDEPAFARAALRPSRDDDAIENEAVQRRRKLWRAGATLQGIRWYEQKLVEFKGKVHRMQSEFPTTPEEAFQSTGARFFGLDLTGRIRSQADEPAAVGRLVGDDVDGAAALEGLHLVTDAPTTSGPLRVWRRPDEKVWWGGELLNPPGTTISRRYCAFVDFGGKTDQADWSVVTIADRIKMLDGGPAEVVARLRIHTRPDKLAWMSAQLATWYDEALLAYEINRHRKDRGDDVRGYEPEWSLAVIEEVMDVYDNLFLRKVQDRVDDPVRYEVGFHTNQSTKPLILNTLEAGLSTDAGGQTFFDPDVQLADEMATFEIKEDGRLGAVDGNHDDVVISSAGTAWLALRHMDPPRRLDTTRTRQNGTPSAARF